MRRVFFIFVALWLGLVPAFAGGMVESKLYFGLSRSDGGQVEEAQWRDFLARDVTPRFPEGLTVLDGFGQWRNPQRQVISERSKVLILVHPDTDDDAKALAAIKAEYCKRFNQVSVFQTDQDVRVVE